MQTYVDSAVASFRMSESSKHFAGASCTALPRAYVNGGMGRRQYSECLGMIIARKRTELFRLLLASASAAALTAISTGSASAVETWTGTTNNDWTVGSNWNGAVPTAADTININSAANSAVLGVNGPANGATSAASIGTLSGQTGVLTIQNGSTLTSSSQARLGIVTGSSGIVTVTGAGSQWLIPNTTLAVGFAGNGILNIQDGARVFASGGSGTVVGSGAASSGTVNINGLGTLETQTLRGGPGASQANFDNGIVKATVSNATFINGFAGTELNILAGGLTIDTAGFTVGTDAASGFTGAGGLTVTGGGVFNLLANSLYSGATSIQAGNSLFLQGAGAIAISSRVIADGTFDISGVTATGSDIESLAGSGAVTLGTKALTITNANDTFAGVIGGTGGLTVAGGTQTLSGANTYTGGTTITAGILQIGDGGTSGSIVDNVLDNGALSFNRSDVSAFNGVITGTGAVNQIGAGTTILTGANSFSGGTFLNAGKLQVSNDTNLGDAAGGLTFNGGTLQNTASFATARNIVLTGNGTLQTDGDLTISGVASGAGTLTKTGIGKLILTGGETYTGGTIISAGTLQIGSGGTSGSIAGDVTDNGALAFNRSDAVAFGSTISGSGSVNQVGSGTTTLSAANTYTGGTAVSAGSLVGSATSFGNGAIADNAALIINQPIDASLGNALNGPGSFTKQGVGRLNYTGVGTLSGSTTVAAGTLSVNGALASSAVTVQSGASLGGNGTVGATTVQSGGTIAPGNSIGTLHVNGAYAQAAGSAYQVEVDPASNASDQIAVNGAGTLASGAGLNVTKTGSGDYKLGTIYTVLTTTSGLTGSYALSGQTAALTPYIGLKDSYDSKNAYLTVVQTADPAGAAQTPNQAAVGGAVDSLPPANPVDTGVLNSPDPASARSAFDQLSGEALASAKGVLISSSFLVRDTTLDRLRDVFCAAGDDKTAHDGSAGCVASTDRPTVWVQGFGDWGQVNGNGNASGVSQSTGGFLVGADVPVQDWRIGVFGGYSRSDFNVGARASTGVSDNYHLGAYGGRQWGDLGLRLGASYSWSGIDTDRLVAFSSFTNDLKATYNAGTTQVFGELGQQFMVDQFGLEPFANLAYVNLRTGGFSEVGGEAALTSKADTTEDTFSTLGVRPSTTISLGSVSATLRGMLGWRHTFGEVTPSSVVSFAGSSAFTVDGAPIARDAGLVEAGVSVNVSGNAAVGLTYGGQFSSRQTDNGIRGTLAITF